MLGTIHAGIGATKVNAFLTTMNLPPIHHKTLKRREREVGVAAETLAKRSCSEALQQECQMTDD